MSRQLQEEPTQAHAIRRGAQSSERCPLSACTPLPVCTQVRAAPAAAPAHSCWTSPRDRPEEREISHPSKKSSGWKPPSAAGVMKAITSGQKYRHLTTSANYKSKHPKNFKVHRTFVLTIHIYHCIQVQETCSGFS